ncbi:cobyric acid synthase [Catenovulum sediminis]|uniref:cobyric acid synthase n=1 Tax=Catenovulum sediminis TaxID=1740262 RepID=UPI00117EAB07|nr:cobyric acid synthase [Catenovulum sediminis]
MINKTIMVQGTSSDAGKSMLVAALCRIFARQNFKVAPFKPQNMALNSAVTPCGGEIGRAQAVQALAAGVELNVHFNPILLKPSSDTGAQVIMHGRALSHMQAAAYHDYKKVAMEAVLQSHQYLNSNYDLIVVEGAGSPAEINLREGDIANMGFAEAADCPVILVADIDRGGVFAQIVGTLDLLSPSERKRVKGFIINKFRGDISLLQSGLDWLEAKTNKPVLGVLPFLKGLDVAAEDAIVTQQNLSDAKLKIVVPVFPRISNHTDFDALRSHPQIDLQFIAPDQQLPSADLIILPGSKNVRADCQHLKNMGWDNQINKHLRYGGKVFGICGGYQMLGQNISDSLGIEDTPGTIQGLNLLPITTELKAGKTLKRKSSVLQLAGQKVKVSGYEIHCGESQLSKHHLSVSHLLTNELANESNETDGFITADQQVAGCYLHGIFDSPEAIKLLAQWCNQEVSAGEDHQTQQLKALDMLADACEKHLDIGKIKHFISNQTNQTNQTGEERQI